MATPTSTYKVLAQSAPSAATTTDIYTAAYPAVISSVVIANRGSADTHGYVYIRKSTDGAIANKNIILAAQRLPANGFVSLVSGLTLGTGDILSVNCNAANCSVSVFGDEKSQTYSQIPKILGQILSSSGVLSDVYAVPAAKSALISTVTLANFASAQLIRLAVSVGGGAVQNKDYLLYDYSMPVNAQNAPANDLCNLQLTLGITLAATDVLRAYANGPELAVGVFGVEIS